MSSNSCTVVRTSQLAAIEHPDPMDVARDFPRRYPKVKAALAEHRAQGVLLMLFDPRDGVVARGWVRASLDKTRAVVVGRHSHCAIRAPELVSEISLRHLAVLVRAVDHDRTRLRVLDLGTSIGFSDEAARPLQAVAAEGTIFLRLGPLDLWMFTTSPDDPPLEDAQDAYRCIPPRVFVEEKVGPPPLRGPLLRGVRGPVPEGATPVLSMVGPLADVRRLCADDEAPVGRLVVHSGTDELSRKVGPHALARGILVGRYERCDLVRSRHDNLSRVHLLVVQDGDDVLAVDTASTNGTELEGEPMTQAPLRKGSILVLPDQITVTWA